MNPVHVMSMNLSEMLAGTHLLWQAPSDGEGGGLTILGAGLSGITAGTTTVALYTLSNAGTPAINGTICAAFGGTIAAGVPFTATVTDGWVDGGEWVGAVIVGAPVDGDILSMRYTMGR
jgi:hypothetical protein